MKMSNNTFFKKAFFKKASYISVYRILSFSVNNFAKAFRIINLQLFILTNKSEKSLISYM